MGLDHHRVFMYTPGLSVSNQKDSPQRQTTMLSDVTGFFAFAQGRGKDPSDLTRDQRGQGYFSIGVIFFSKLHCLLTTWIKNTYSQTSRLENPEELQPHHNQKRNHVFDCAVALFAQCKIRFW
jgi:hypothetical protein